MSERLALRKIWLSILGYLLGLFDMDKVQSFIKDIQIDLDYKNQNVRGLETLKKEISDIDMNQPKV